MFLTKVTFLKSLTNLFPYINLVLWQHVVLCKLYAAENVPDYGCASCVTLCESLTQCNT